MNIEWVAEKYLPNTESVEFYDNENTTSEEFPIFPKINIFIW